MDVMPNTMFYNYLVKYEAEELNIPEEHQKYSNRGQLQGPALSIINAFS